ncbi:MAG: PH domain-containing protein [Prolixibacteraceae bacterium]|nr:PH domain-containing protein [Prolixibacteraceae bacterium]
MIQNTVYFKSRPSQLINLETFLLTILAVPVILLMDGILKQQLPVQFIPAKLIVHIYSFPHYLGVFVLLNLAYQVLRVYCIRYEIHAEELRYYSGIFRRKHEFIENYRIKDYRVERPLIYRLFGLGNLIIYTSDKTTPVFRLDAIRNPEEKYKVLRGLVELNRREKHVFEVD